jgi:tRNA modification GTPase
VETHIDFPEEEMETNVSMEMKRAVLAAMSSVKALLDDYEEGRSLREGVSVLIAGKPNVGKSSILNALLKEKRAIVNPVPGTTRDVIEEIVNIKGLPVKMLDTAGICETDDAIEKEGVELAIGKIGRADLILFVLDSSLPVDENDLRIVKELEGRNFITVLNKCDLQEKIALPQSLAAPAALRMSAWSGGGIEQLLQAIHDHFLHGKAVDSREYVALSNVRHRDALVKCRDALKRFTENEADGMHLELLAVDLRDALQAIGEVTGETLREEVLERIFERFCIGK